MCIRAACTAAQVCSAISAQLIRSVSLPFRWTKGASYSTCWIPPGPAFVRIHALVTKKGISIAACQRSSSCKPLECYIARSNTTSMAGRSDSQPSSGPVHGQAAHMRGHSRNKKSDPFLDLPDEIELPDRSSPAQQDNGPRKGDENSLVEDVCTSPYKPRQLASGG